jgi:probable F420-dependent oxidoreductase
MDSSDGSTRLQLALGLQSHAGLHGGHARGLVELGRLAEAAGLDGVVIGDHVVLGPRLDRYPYPPVHFAADASWMEPLTVLASVAALTSRLTLTTGVLVSPLRPAVLLAKTAATLDAIAGGRLELGVGVGWQPEEFAAVGVPFERRGEITTDGIRACKALWSASPAEFHSGSVEFAGLRCHPQPPRDGDIPVLFSGSLHRRNVERIATLGTGWITHPGQPLDEIAAGADTLRTAFEARARDPAELRIRTRLPVARADDGGLDLEMTFAALDAYRDAGVTDLTVWSTSLAKDAGPLPGRVAALGEAWTRQRGELSAG